EGTLTFAGDGPLRGQLEGRAGVQLLGRVAHDEMPRLLADSHVLCQPSLIEPLGQALLEALACGRSVVATRIGGPPEFVPPEAGLAGDRERLLPALSRLLRVDALLQPVVARHEELLDARARVFALHKGTVTTQSVWHERARSHRRRPPPVRGGPRGDPVRRR